MSQHAAPTIEELRQLSPAHRATLLLERREGQYFDRKSSRTSPRDLAEVMVAFANSGGGLIVVGIWGGQVEGVDGMPKQVSEWRRADVNFASGAIPHRAEKLTCQLPDGTIRSTLLIEVVPQSDFHQMAGGNVFLRSGDSSLKLNATQAQQLALDRSAMPYELRPAEGASYEDLDQSRIKRYLASIPVVTDPVRAFRARGLIAPDRRDGPIRPTNAGVLLFGQTPQEFLPHARTRVIKYRGLERGTGAAHRAGPEITCDGTLADQVDRALEFLRETLPHVTRLDPSVGRFLEKPLVPEGALLESIVNAAVHRSYSVTGDHARIELFDDRLEVTSPGRLAGYVTPETIAHERYARNPVIARVMAELEYGRETGEGIRRMFEALASAGLARPLFRQGTNSFTVTFLLATVFTKLIEALPRGSDRFVEHLRAHARVTTGEAEVLLGRTRPPTLALLKVLRKQRLLQWVGKSSRDPTAYWRLPQGELTAARDARREPKAPRVRTKTTLPARRGG